jgi:hypothetical protein
VLKSLRRFLWVFAESSKGSLLTQYYIYFVKLRTPQCPLFSNKIHYFCVAFFGLTEKIKFLSCLYFETQMILIQQQNQRITLYTHLAIPKYFWSNSLDFY